MLVSPLQADECKLPKADLASARKVTVTQVVDGDTLRLSSGKLVRFIGINTPEIDHQYGRSQPYAEQAREHLNAIVSRYHNRVVLQFGSDLHDRHGRLLAHVFAPDGLNIQAELLHEGLGAWIVVPPNLEYMNCYRDSENDARVARAGVWSKQFSHARETKSLRDNDTGFQWIRGKIIRIGKGRTNWWLNFEDSVDQRQGQQKHSRVTLRVHKDDLHYFKEQRLENLVNKVVRVKGWLSKYKKQLVMSLRHPASLEIVNK